MVCGYSKPIQKLLVLGKFLPGTNRNFCKVMDGCRQLVDKVQLSLCPCYFQPQSYKPLKWLNSTESKSRSTNNMRI